MDNKVIITEDMTIAEAIELKPYVAEVLDSVGMHCLHCAIAFGETIRGASEHHNIPIDELLNIINKE